jgi:hypothetical protein
MAVTVAFLLALVISVTFPITSYWPLLLLLLADPAERGMKRMRGAGDRAAT